MAAGSKGSHLDMRRKTLVFQSLEEDEKCSKVEPDRQKKNNLFLTVDRKRNFRVPGVPRMYFFLVNCRPAENQRNPKSGLVSQVLK